MDLSNLIGTAEILPQAFAEFFHANNSHDYSKTVLNFILKILKVNERNFFNSSNLRQLKYHNLCLNNYFSHLDESETYKFDSYDSIISRFLTAAEENNVDLLPNELNDHSNFLITILDFFESLINNKEQESSSVTNAHPNLTNDQKTILKFIGARLTLPFLSFLGKNCAFQTNERPALLNSLFNKCLEYAMSGIRSCNFGIEIASEIRTIFENDYKLLAEERFFIVPNILEVHNKKIQSEMSELLNHLITTYPNETEIANLMKYLKTVKKIPQLFLINKSLLNESFVTALIAINPICSTDQLFKTFLKIFHCNNNVILRNLVGELYIKLLKSVSTNINNSDILANSLKYLSQSIHRNGISIFFDTFWDFEFIKDSNNIITNIINIITNESNLNAFITKFCVEYGRKLCEKENYNSNNNIGLITKIPLLLDKLKDPQDITRLLEIFKVIDLKIYKQLDQKHFERILNKINHIQKSCTEFNSVNVTINVNLLSQIFIVLDLFSSADLDQSKKKMLAIKDDSLLLFHGCFQRLTANETNNKNIKLYKVLTISLIKLTCFIDNVKFKNEEEYAELYKYLIEFFEKQLLVDKIFKKLTFDFDDITAESYAIKCFRILLQRYYSNHCLLIRTFLQDEYTKFQKLCYYFVKYLLQPDTYIRNEIDYVSNKMIALMCCFWLICNPKAEKFYMASVRNVLYNETINQLVLVFNKYYEFWDQSESVVDRTFELFYKNLIQLHCMEIDSDSIFKILLNTDLSKWNMEIKELLNVVVVNQDAEGTASLLAALIFEIAVKRIKKSSWQIVDELQKTIQEKLPIKARDSDLDFLIIESASIMKVLEKLAESVSKRNQIPEDGNIMIALKFLKNFLQYFREYPAKIELLKTEVHNLKLKIWVWLNPQELQSLLIFQKELNELVMREPDVQ